MTAPAPIVIDATELVPGRGFAHPDHVFTDRATMRMLTADFRRHLIESASGPIARYTPSEEDWMRRVIIPRPDEAAPRVRFAVVGFFGRRRDEVSPDVVDEINRLGRTLVEAIPRATGVLGYLTHLLVDEKNYANLVVFDSFDSIQAWRDTTPHPVAAEMVSPDYYEHVRIYRGLVDVVAPEPDGFALTLDCVKYWDFRNRPTWHAIRNLSG